jgi:hypothetical protein
MRHPKFRERIPEEPQEMLEKGALLRNPYSIAS